MAEEEKEINATELTPNVAENASSNEEEKEINATELTRNVAEVEVEDENVGKKVELADKDCGFYDPTTEFQLVRKDRKKLTEPIGAATKTALVSGQLLIVGK